jgi:excisionase family DNA binding protein
MTPHQPLAPLDVMQRYTLTEACRYLRTSRESLYKLINSGRLRPIKQEKRTYIPGADIARLSRSQDAA